VLDRVGKLGTTNIRLAKWRPAEGRYQRRLSPVSPSEGFIAGDQFQLNAVPDTQVWHINEWSGGEGNDVYSEDERDVYNRSSGVRPKPTDEGLILGALGATTTKTGGSAFTEGERFSYGSGTLFVGYLNKHYNWDASTEEWENPVTTAATGTLVATIYDLLYGTFSSYTEGSAWKIYKNGAVHNSQFVYPTPLATFKGNLYGLDGDDLYQVSMVTADNRTLLVDVSQQASSFANSPEQWHRLFTSDKGLVWWQMDNDGKVLLWEYNVGAATGGIIGELFHRRSYPYSGAAVAGAYVVAYRQAFNHSFAGDAFLHVQRGDIRSIVPLRSVSGSTASKPVLIAGTSGSDLIVYFDGAVWAYNLDTGGLYMVGLQATAPNGVEPTDAVTFEDDVFLAGVYNGSSTKMVERVRLDRYMSSGTYESGRFDVRYPGLPKLLTEVTVNTGPLPASTSVGVAVSTDGGSYVNLAGSHDVDGATSKTFVASDASTSFIGRDFELKLTLNGTSTATPTIRSVTAVVTGAAHLEEWVMELDVSDIDSPGSQSGWKLVDDLRTLAASQQVVTFLNPWEQRDVDAADSIPVRVMDVIVPQGGRGDAYATVRVRRTQLVVAS